MGSPIMPSFNSLSLLNGNTPTAPRDATAVAPPNFGYNQLQPQQEQPQVRTYYEKLRELFDEVVFLSHEKDSNGNLIIKDRRELDDYVRQKSAERFSGGSHFRTVSGLARKLMNLERTGARPIEESDLNDDEKGALARTTLFGSWFPGLAQMSGGLDFVVPGGRGYKEGRDTYREYIKNARQFAVSGGDGEESSRGAVADIATNPELWNLPASILATMGLGAPAAATRIGPTIPGLAKLPGAISRVVNPSGFLASTLSGAGIGAAYGLENIDNMEDLERNAVPLSVQTALGGMLGGAGSLYAKRLANVNHPGAVQAERVLEASGMDFPGGGPSVLRQIIEESGVPRPLLAELESSSFAGLAGEMRRTSREATHLRARRLLATEQRNVARAKKAFDPAYEALKVDVNDPRVAELMSHARVQDVVRAMIRDKQIVAGQALTGRNIEDIRQELGKRATRAYRRRDSRVGELFEDFEEQARLIVDEAFEHMPEVRRQLQPLILRERRLRQVELNLLRPPRGSGVAQEGRITAGGEALQDIKGDKFQRQHRMYQQLAPTLFTPGTADEHLARIAAMMPHYNRIGYGGIAGPLAARAINPFFQMQPDSTQQEQ